MFRKIALVYCLCVCTLTTAFGQQKEGWIVIKGLLKGFSNQAEIEDMSEFQYLLPPSSERMVVPDANGNFNLKFKAAAPNYYRLGRNALYLTPGDHLEVFIDKNNPRIATFKGQGAAANSYMKNTPFPKGGSFIEAGKFVKESPEATVAAVEEQAAMRTKELAAVQNISSEFRRLETARIKADLINSINSGKTYGVYKLKLQDTAAKAYVENYQKAVAQKLDALTANFVDPSLMKMVVYRDIADDLVQKGGKPAEVQSIKDWYAASTLVSSMQKVSDKSGFAAFKSRIAGLKTERYKMAANKMLEHLTAFGKGDLAVDFTAIDLNGKNVNLSSLKGKVIYVDIWATWCGPCMQEMPHFEKLKQQYKDNPNVVFVSLSIDDTESPWKQSVASRKADGYQWLINRSKLKAYNIVGIPRCLLIDQHFKMVDMSAPMPSEPAVTKVISGLLN